MWTDDPIADFYRHEEEQQRKIDRMPVCECCGEPIDQYSAVHIGDAWYCDDCLDDMREPVEPCEDDD